MSETKIIPIFPLDLVLFPRQELPLRIFEPRYKQLVDDCMLGDGQFGVCLIDEQSSVNGWNSPKLVNVRMLNWMDYNYILKQWAEIHLE